MDVNTPLYVSDRIKVTYLHSPEPGKRDEVVSTEDHELWVRSGEGDEWHSYIIQRGILGDLAERTGRLGEFERMIDNFSPLMIPGIRDKGIPLRDVASAVFEAYQKQEQEFEKYLTEQKKSRV